MRLSDLFDIPDEDDTEVLGLACDSSKVERGFVFFCLVGQTSDGHTFAQEAVSRGAVALVVERKRAIHCGQIEKDNTKRDHARAAAKF